MLSEVPVLNLTSSCKQNMKISEKSFYVKWQFQ